MKAMNDTTTSLIARSERPESQDGGKLGQLGGAARRARSTTWPAEVSSGGARVFSSHRTLKGLKGLGLSDRSRRDGYQVAQGRRLLGDAARPWQSDRSRPHAQRGDSGAN